MCSSIPEPSPTSSLPKVFALTGGIGSGKSAVATLFEEWGASVVDADVLAREVVAPESEGLAEVVKLFGEEVLSPDGTLNRKSLGSTIFSDPQKRLALEGLLHPLIRARWMNRLSDLKRNSSTKIIVYVVPLFFESRASFPEITETVLVTAPEGIRLDRIMKRDGCSEEQARSRIQAQLSDNEKIARSTFVLSNDSTEAELATRARVVFDQL